MELSWSEKIIELEGRGWSLKSLSETTALSPQSLSDIKAGRTKQPTGMAAVRIHTLFTSGMRPDARTSHSAEAATDRQ